jgi:peptidoglycan/xylan/chitin deacetylase (PgdA/CDA1 family)
MVPNYTTTSNYGDCSTNTAAVSDGRCWWTCGGCSESTCTSHRIVADFIARETDITECPDKLTWGLSYDDGPSPYTPLLLDYLNEVNLTTTFFVVGSRVISRPEMLQSEYMAGHQISIHTWSHPYLTSLTNEQIVAELGWTKQVIKDTLGVTPNTFRPPYGDIDDRVRAIAAQMGLTPIMWTAYNDNGVTNYFDTVSDLIQ